MKKVVVIFGTCIILTSTAFNTTYVNSETQEGKMYDLYDEADPDGGRHIGGEH